MNQYNPKFHHRRSIRLKGYDYAQAGLYFITICCQNRIHRFGHVENGVMVLNEFGTVAYNAWMKTPEIRPNMELGDFVVMPNHIHGIIRLVDGGELHSPNNMPNNTPNETMGELHSSIVWGECNSPLRGPSNNIGAIVRGYKSTVTKQLNLLNVGCAIWQRNYHEHIIRDAQSYQRISEYIINNPAKWTADKFHTK
jgi:putative transposase